MHPELLTWLSELETDGIYLSNESGSGANENKWMIGAQRELGIEAHDFVSFILQAVEIRRAQAIAIAAGPATFYTWHDDMAGQLRFSTAHCTKESLPFGAPTFLVERPDEIVDDWLASPYLDGIPWSELKEVKPDERDEPEDVPRPAFAVWAVALLP